MKGPIDGMCLLYTISTSGQCPVTLLNFKSQVTSNMSNFTLSQGCPKVFLVRQLDLMCLSAMWLFWLYTIPLLLLKSVFAL
jgi:hypothetical protein